MRILKRILVWTVSIVVALAVGGGLWLRLAPPEFLKVAVNYSAKIICSNVFVAGRELDDVLSTDVQAPGIPLFWFVEANVDEGGGTVETSIAGLFGKGLAVDRQGVGCAVVPDGDTEQAIDHIGPFTSLPPFPAELPWPEGDKVEEDARVTEILDDPALIGPGMRAVVVVKDGRIAGERYAAGFDKDTRLIGWSMTKTVNAALVGRMVREKILTLDKAGLFAGWSDDSRSEIKLADMMSMSSGLEFGETYGWVSDATRMLYIAPDMAAFASSKPQVSAVGEAFNYSSGTAVMISRIWQDVFVDPTKALDFPVKALFDPIGMRSAVLETDARGTFVGSSYLYANARDWARFGQFLLQRGVWGGRSLLPIGYVDWMVAPNPVSMAQWGKPEYGNGQIWLHGPSADAPEGTPPDEGFDLPEDAYWMLGHDGQTTTIIPSAGLVVVRLGLTPTSAGYKPQALVEALVGALR